MMPEVYKNVGTGGKTRIGKQAFRVSINKDFTFIEIQLEINKLLTKIFYILQVFTRFLMKY